MSLSKKVDKCKQCGEREVMRCQFGYMAVCVECWKSMSAHTKHNEDKANG